MTNSHVVLGAGPVGRAVVAALARRNIEPAVVTRSGAAVPGAISRRADLTDPDDAASAVTGAEVVFQCAQPAYHRWPEEFPALQARVVDAAASAGALLVVADNLYGYGPVSVDLTEDLPLEATTRKGAVRAQMWLDLEAAHRAGRLRVVSARASDFFGPGVEASAVGGRFFGALTKGKPVQVVGDPDRLHTYTYVPDFGEAMVRLSAAPETWGRAWHVPNAPTVSTRPSPSALRRSRVPRSGCAVCRAGKSVWSGRSCLRSERSWRCCTSSRTTGSSITRPMRRSLATTGQTADDALATTIEAQRSGSAAIPA